MSLKCQYCGRFVGYAKVSWEMPYTGSRAVMLEPPELEPVCPRCRDDGDYLVIEGKGGKRGYRRQPEGG